MSDIIRLKLVYDVYVETDNESLVLCFEGRRTEIYTKRKTIIKLYLPDWFPHMITKVMKAYFNRKIKTANQYMDRMIESANHDGDDYGKDD